MTCLHHDADDIEGDCEQNRDHHGNDHGWGEQDVGKGHNFFIIQKGRETGDEDHDRGNDLLDHINDDACGKGAGDLVPGKKLSDRDACKDHQKVGQTTDDERQDDKEQELSEGHAENRYKLIFDDLSHPSCDLGGEYFTAGCADQKRKNGECKQYGGEDHPHERGDKLHIEKCDRFYGQRMGQIALVRVHRLIKVDAQIDVGHGKQCEDREHIHQNGSGEKELNDRGNIREVYPLHRLHGRADRYEQRRKDQNAVDGKHYFGSIFEFVFE